MNFFQKRHPAIQDRVSEIEDTMPQQYIDVLRLVYDIRRNCQGLVSDEVSNMEQSGNDLKSRGKSMT